MGVLFKGTRISMNLISDWITLRYRDVETGKVIEINHLDDEEEILKGRKTIELPTDCRRPAFETVIEESIIILDNYDRTDYRLMYEYKGAKYISDRIIELRKFYKPKLDAEIELDKIIQKMGDELGLGKLLDSVVDEAEETCIVTTEDGLQYYFDIL